MKLYTTSPLETTAYLFWALGVGIVTEGIPMFVSAHLCFGLPVLYIDAINPSCCENMYCSTAWPWLAKILGRLTACHFIAKSFDTGIKSPIRSKNHRIAALGKKKWNDCAPQRRCDAGSMGLRTTAPGKGKTRGNLAIGEKPLDS